MRPTRRNNKSQLDAEAQDDPEERWLNAAREIHERIGALGPESPEGRAYDQLKAIMGEGSLIDALQKMLRQVRTTESLLAADKNRKKETPRRQASFAGSPRFSSGAKGEPSSTSALTPSLTPPSHSVSSTSSRTQSPISRRTTSACQYARSSASASIRAAAPIRARTCQSGMQRSAAAQRKPKIRPARIATSLSRSSPP